jgi:hypothetical protein
MDTKIKNPKTNRWIKVGSKTYNDLAKNNALPKPQNRVTRQVKKFVPPTDYRVPQSFQPYPVDRSDTPWGQKKPQKKGERTDTFKKCGESCFLKPDTLSFPICNKTPPCTYNCRGIKAASSRAGQWKYTDVLKTSKLLSAKFDCYKKNRVSATKNDKPTKNSSSR